MNHDAYIKINLNAQYSIYLFETLNKKVKTIWYLSCKFNVNSNEF